MNDLNQAKAYQLINELFLLESDQRLAGDEGKACQTAAERRNLETLLGKGGCITNTL